MLVLMRNEDLSNYWGIFEEVIRECVPSTPDVLPDRLNFMLQRALLGTIQCWVGLDEDGEDYGYAVTKVAIDELSGQSTLLIYALKLIKRMSRSVRDADLEGIVKFARTQGCSRISAYCGSQALANSAVKSLGTRCEVIPYILCAI